MSDFITLIRTTKPCNKLVTLDGNGKLSKKPSSLISTGVARTYHVPDMAALSHVLNDISEQTNVTMVLGFIEGTEPKTGEIGSPYTINSLAKMAGLLGVPKEDCPSGLKIIDGRIYATRTKSNFSFSSWILFDYDRVPGMPESMETGSLQEWWGWLADLVPGLKDVSHIITPSTSSRVKLNGMPAFPDGGWHAYVQVEDANDIKRFGNDLLIHAMTTPYGFMRPLFSEKSQEIMGHRPWMITDPTTFSPERLVFDGSPIVQGEGLTVSATTLTKCEGRRLDTTQLQVAADAAKKINEKTGFKVEKTLSGYMLNNNRDLQLATEVETEKGLITVGDYWLSEHGKLRVQAPFRPDSNSMAAYLNRHEDGSPFLFDVGSQTKYTLDRKDKVKHLTAVALKWVEDSPAEAIPCAWLDHAKGLDPIEQDNLRHAVHKKTGIELRPLTAVLKEAQKEWVKQAKVEAFDVEKSQRREQGHEVVEWSADRLNDVVVTVRKKLTEHREPGLVLSYGGQLVTVNIGQPTSVRQMIKKALEGEDYPDQYRVFTYTPVTCQMRVLDSVAFFSGDKPAGCPDLVAKALLDDSSFAPALSGLIEVPTVTPQGRLLSEPGYDSDTGYFCAFDKRLAEGINRNPTREDAAKALSYISNVVFADFPFGTEGDRAAAIAFLLTGFVRRFLAKAPGFMLTATTQGSGKSTLADIVFHAAFGRPAAAATWSQDQAEIAKLFLAILMEGQSGICFDNLPYGCRVDGDELAKFQTQEVYQGRILGSNKSVALPTNVLVCLTGNQLTAVNDMQTRLLPIYLQPDVENPESRVFNRQNIDAWHDDNRAKIVGAVCTILLAWHCSDTEIELRPSRFAEWDEVVRKPLVWLGLPDPVEQFELNKDEDPVRAARGEMLRAWFDLYGEGWVDLKDIARHGGSFPGSSDMGVAMAELFPDNRPTAAHVGHKFRYFKDTIIDGLKLIQKPKNSKSKRSRPWRIVAVGSSASLHDVGG